jgi:hypothetical protein
VQATGLTIMYAGQCLEGNGWDLQQAHANLLTVRVSAFPLSHRNWLTMTNIIEHIASGSVFNASIDSPQGILRSLSVSLHTLLGATHLPTCCALEGRIHPTAPHYKHLFHKHSATFALFRFSTTPSISTILFSKPSTPRHQPVYHYHRIRLFTISL